MITFTSGNIFDAKVEALVNPVNCVGVMGKGLALEFKNRFPDNYEAYKVVCSRHELNLGHLLTIDYWDTTKEERFAHRYVINFPTKHHWKDQSNICDIASGLDRVVILIGTYDIQSIAIPALGCGLGGLDWNDVKPLMIEMLSCLEDVDIQIYEPM